MRAHDRLMHVRRGYRFRLKLTHAEQATLRRVSGCCRYVWNELLTENERRRKAGQAVLSYGAMCRHLTALKAERTFLQEAYSNSLQQTLRDLSTAYRRAFDPKIGAGFPRLKKRRRGIGIRFPAGFRINGRGLYLPKIGWVGFRKSRRIDGRVKNVTLRHDGDHWYVSMQTECEVPDQVHPSTRAIGIDVGIARFAALSDGSFVDGPNALKRHLRHLKVLQRRMDRKRTFSKNWGKARYKVTRLHRKIANIRSDATHKASTTISKNHVIVVLEELQIPNMVASARGTREHPGRNIAAKSGLNRRILDQGWAQFSRRLTYKLAARGGKVLFVEPRDTSCTCARCDYTSKANRKTQTRFQCVSCGFVANADTNASMIILRRAGLGPDSLWRCAVTCIGEAGSSASAAGVR